MLKLVEPGSEQERQGRAALARIVRQGIPGLDSYTCNHLADVIDPDGNCSLELVLKTRSGGCPPEYVRDVQIGGGMADDREAGASLKDAIHNAMRLHGISIATANRIWSKYGRIALATRRALLSNRLST